ncbi:MAG TPA: S26 family signal peptidase [Candidatus Methylomirabilis sp.]|nr:S26 family signal peptidase [Candidatus Methylomirabilis sp.]HSC70109.1 S26 family signal peptidase [Candidatus Methylomirabilis sp.]
MTDLSARGNPTWEAACAELLRCWVAGGASAWLPLHGHSMAPFLPGGSKILVSKTTAGRIGCGDLFVYEEEGRLVCHRVLRRRARGSRYAYLTKGDGWGTMESWVAEEQVLGKVPRVERDGREVDLNTAIGRLHAVTAAASSLVVIGLRRLLRWGRGRLAGRRAWVRLV